MKNFLLATTLLLAVVSGYLATRLFNITRLKTPPQPTVCPALPYNYSTAGFEGVINYETAKALYTNYVNDDAKARISRKVKGRLDPFIEKEEDTKSVWFSLDRLKNFIWHIEEQNCANGCNDSLGMRIYFAKYPDLTDPGQTPLLGLIGLPQNYSNHHTLFMVPTYKDESGDNIDFYPGGKTCRTPFDQSPLQTFPPGSEPIVIPHLPSPYIFLMGTTQDAQNHGGLIPPGKPAGTSFK